MITINNLIYSSTKSPLFILRALYTVATIDSSKWQGAINKTGMVNDLANLCIKNKSYFAFCSVLY